MKVRPRLVENGFLYAAALCSGGPALHAANVLIPLPLHGALTDLIETVRRAEKQYRK